MVGNGLRSLRTASDSDLRITNGWATKVGAEVVYGVFDLGDGQHLYVLRTLPIGDGEYETGGFSVSRGESGVAIRELEKAIPFGARSAIAAPLVSHCNGTVLVYLASINPFDESGKPKCPVLYDAPALSHMPPGGIAVFRNPGRRIDSFIEPAHGQEPGEPRIMHVKVEELEGLEEVRPVQEEGSRELLAAFERAVVFC